MPGEGRSGMRVVHHLPFSLFQRPGYAGKQGAFHQKIPAGNAKVRRGHMVTDKGFYTETVGEKVPKTHC